MKSEKPTRSENRSHDQIRTLKLKRKFTSAAPGSVLVSAGNTTILVTASIEDSVPPFLRGSDKGWVTAEYNMLPGSTEPRKRRARSGSVDGRTVEIQRLIGRSLRQAIDLTAIPGWSVTIDCDVIKADGGTRTASITGGFVALVDAVEAIGKKVELLRTPIIRTIAAVSVGLVDGKPLLDLDYEEDVRASVDMNLVLTGSGSFVEVQGTGEESPFNRKELDALLKIGTKGAADVTEIQKKALGRGWPGK